MANKDINKQLEVVDGSITQEEANAPEYTRVYQVYPNSKIPVSKKLGSFWHRRQKEGLTLLEQSNVKERWDEAISYYQNDQGGKSARRRGLSRVPTGRDADTGGNYGTENIVFANTSALVPAVYAKNPDVTLTADKDGQEPQIKMYERLLDKLFNRKITPGLGLKAKMRRATVMAMLTNLAYLELSYVKKEDSSEEAVNEIMQLSQALTDAKTTDEIARVEGKLMALDEKVSILSSSGPRLRVRPPHCVIVDPNSEEADLSDASYVMIEDYIRTELLRAMYGNRDPETGVWRPIFDPTHVVSASKTDISGHDEDVNHFTLLDDTEDEAYKKYGYKNEDDFKDACRTRVWYVWDKTTRRVLMFSDKDWSMPIWVWDDPYKLSRFFPIFALSFYTDPIDRYARSEVMYYLDQQDEINRINNERARMRHWVLTKVFVNTSVINDVPKIQEFLSDETDRTVHGLKLPENVKISDVISTLPAPSTQYEQLFDTAPILQSVNRLSSVTPVLQNEQFKTNTTNKAIESYNSSTQTRLDEKIDAIEDLLGDLGVALLEMCIQFMDEQTVEDLIGSNIVREAGWTQYADPRLFHQTYTFKIVGGSTLKPTSKTKKEQAVQLGQLLGQFASATPAVLLVALRMIQRAFQDDFVVTDDDWSLIGQAIQASLTSQPAPSANGGGRPTNGAPGQSQDAQQVVAGVQAVANMIDKLDPRLKAEVGAAIAKGVPLKQIVAQLVQQQ